MTAGPELDEVALLALPGVMRALWPSVCRGCDTAVEPGDVVALADTDSGRAWVCRPCHPSQHLTRQPSPPGDPLTQPPDPMTVPGPRRGDRASEGARS